MDERSVRGELEDYLRSRDLNEYFTSIIESCLLTQPTNPSLHIITHLFKTYPEQIPQTIAAAIDDHNVKIKTNSSSNSASSNSKVKGGVGVASAGQESSNSAKEDARSSVSAPVAADDSVSSESDKFTDDEADDAAGESPVDATMLKHLAVAADGGIHVRIGGWAGGRDRSNGEEGETGEDVSRDDIYGGDVRTRAELAVKKIAAVAKQRGTRAFVLRRHRSAGWRDGRRHAVSFPTPAPPPAPEPPLKLGAFLTRVRRDQPFVEVLLPALARCKLCQDLSDFQLILLGEACGPPLSAEPGTVVVPAGPRSNSGGGGGGGDGGGAGDEGQGGMLDSLVVVMAGALSVREVALPAPPHPRFDDGKEFADAQVAVSTAEGAAVAPASSSSTSLSSAAAAAAAESSSSGGGGLVLRELTKLTTGDSFGEPALFAPHEHFKQLAKASQEDDGGALGFDGGGAAGAGGSAGGGNGATAKEVVVPSSAGEGCRFWRLPRRTLHSLRAQWGRDDEELRVNALRGVPALAFSLSELELKQVASLGEERRFLPGEVVCNEGALLENLGIVLQGFCSFERRGQVLMETVGQGAYWGDLSLVQGPRLCQATVRASPQKILSANGPIPTVFRSKDPFKNQAAASGAGAAVKEEDADPSPALVVLVVRVRILERIMGPLVDLLRRHPASKQAGVFSRIVC